MGDWLISDDVWQRWHEQLVVAVSEWAAAHPLLPGMPRQAAAAGLGLPDPGLLDAVVDDDPDLVLDSAGVHSRNQRATLPPDVEDVLDRVLQQLDADPFDAPVIPELAAAPEREVPGRRDPRTARLIRIAAGIYLRPVALDEAVRRLGELDQPFTMARAREALGTTRRVALPLLELLDKSGRTVRVDSQLRQLR